MLDCPPVLAVADTTLEGTGWSAPPVNGPQSLDPRALGTPAAPLSSDLRGRSILVVDDDRINLRILGTILTTEGYRVFREDSGEAALKCYALERPDLVLDVLMAGMSGIETCRVLRKTYGESCAPVIFITAKTDAEDVVEGLIAGGVDYLPKPFHAREVLARIRLHLLNQLLVAKLNQADAAKNRFLGMVAHDLCNPLASVRGLAEFLREGAVGTLTAEQLEVVEVIHTASQTMLTAATELLDVAMIESGGLKVHLSAQDLSHLITKAVAQASRDAAPKQTRIVFESGPVLPLVMIDGSKMRQVIDNLLSNAVKYSPPASQVAVRVFAHPDQRTCGFVVQDSGPGIPAGEEPLLFKPFSRLSTQPTGNEKSTGLGLAICHQIISALHGTITTTNLRGRGCEFCVTLPVPP